MWYFLFVFIDIESDCRSRGRKFESQLGHITFVAIDHKMISAAILPDLLSQKWQLSVTGESTCTK